MEIDLHSFFGNSAKRNNGRDSSSQSKKTKQHGGYNSGNSDSKSAAAAGSSLCPPSSAVSATKICTPPSECNPISTETKLLCDRRDTSVMMLTIPPPSSASHKITTVNGGGGGGGGEGVISPLSGLALTASNSASAASTPSIGLISEPNNDASSTASGLHFYITDDDETGGVSPSSAGVESVRLPFLGGTATAGTGGGKGGCELRPGSGLSRSEGSSPMFFFGSSQHHNHHGHGLGQGHTQSLLSTNRSANGLLLPPPIITFNGVDSSASAPPSPNDTLLLAAAVRKWRLSVGSGAGASMSRDAAAAHRALMVTSSGSLLTMNHLSPSDIRGSSFSLHYPYDNTGEDVCLMYARHEKIPMKDFAAEIRASLDVENFLHQAQLILDLPETNMEDIISTMLHHLLDKEEPQVVVSDAKKAVFSHDVAHQLAKTIQGTCSTYGGGFDYDQSWVCVLCTLSTIQKRHVAIARLKTPANLGRTCQEVYFIILVVAPTKEKGTKNVLETGRTFATLFADMDLRLRLLLVRSEEEFKRLLWQHTKELAEEQTQMVRRLSTASGLGIGGVDIQPPDDRSRCWLGKGLRSDFKRRIKHYWHDYRDGIIGHGTMQKTASTTVFLYFACILPSIALGMMNDTNTGGKLNVKKVIYSQAIGGIFFALFGGQPMVILLTTAPLALYTKVIYVICAEWELDFVAMYACTGLWNAFFLIIYAITDASRILKWATRSTDEIFALFISITFIVNAIRDVYEDFIKYYHAESCASRHGDATGNVANGNASTSGLLANVSAMVHDVVTGVSGDTGDVTMAMTGTWAGGAQCQREHSLLYLFLTLGTVWLGLSLYNFTKTPFLNASKRQLLADYALPVSVLTMSFCGSYVFRDVRLEPFDVDDQSVFVIPELTALPLGAIAGAMGMGFFLSLLIFLDQNIASAIVNSPENKMKKGSAFHWDLLVVGLLNGWLTFFGLPMLHGTLPHSPLHVHAMADVEDRVDQGHVYRKIIHVRETRLTGFFSHILIGLSILLLQYPLAYIPRPVLDGLFLYLACHTVQKNQMFERVMLLVTEQSAYPPHHYIRSVPQRKVHLFTFLQLIQLAAMCAFGFSPLPYLKMVFPVVILLLLPFRYRFVPLLIEKKYLDSLDGH